MEVFQAGATSFGKESGMPRKTGRIRNHHKGIVKNLKAIVKRADALPSRPGAAARKALKGDIEFLRGFLHEVPEEPQTRLGLLERIERCSKPHPRSYRMATEFEGGYNAEVPAAAPDRPENVITSYSIHYTKLYDRKGRVTRSPSSTGPL